MLWSWGRSLVSPPASTLPPLTLPECWSWKGPDQVLRVTKSKERARAGHHSPAGNQKTAPVLPHPNPQKPWGALLIHSPFFLLPQIPAAHPYWGFGRRQSLYSSPHPTPTGSFLLAAFAQTWQRGTGSLEMELIFPLALKELGVGPPMGEGRGQGCKSRHGAKGESDFPKMWGHYLKNQNRGGPGATHEPSCPAPHWPRSARTTAHRSCKPMP